MINGSASITADTADCRALFRNQNWKKPDDDMIAAELKKLRKTLEQKCKQKGTGDIIDWETQIPRHVIERYKENALQVQTPSSQNQIGDDIDNNDKNKSGLHTQRINIFQNNSFGFLCNILTSLSCKSLFKFLSLCNFFSLDAASAFAFEVALLAARMDLLAARLSLNSSFSSDDWVELLSSSSSM